MNGYIVSKVGKMGQQIYLFAAGDWGYNTTTQRGMAKIFQTETEARLAANAAGNDFHAAEARPRQV